jgi:nitrate reductase (NAD(P)H)
VGERGNVGWREEENLARQGLADAQAAAAAPVVAKVAPTSGVRLITMEEVEKHTTEESAWFVHEGKVRGRAAAVRALAGRSPAAHPRW